MKFGVIGAGRIGKIHGGNIAARGDTRVAYVADADVAAAKALADSTGAQAASVEEIIDSHAVDAVAICSPTDTHADLIERAARAGKAIFCEKPIDLDANRIRKCLEVVRSAGATLMIGFNRRFDSNFATLRKRVAVPACGAVVSLIGASLPGDFGRRRSSARAGKNETKILFTSQDGMYILF